MFFEDRLSTVLVPAPYIGAGQEALNSHVWDAEDGLVAEQDTLFPITSFIVGHGGGEKP